MATGELATNKPLPKDFRFPPLNSSVWPSKQLIVVKKRRAEEGVGGEGGREGGQNN